MHTTDSVYARADSTATGAILGTRGIGDKGTLVGGPVGPVTDGSIRWKVAYDVPPSGWSTQRYLTFDSLPAPVRPPPVAVDTAFAWPVGSRVHARDSVCAHASVTYAGACGTMVVPGTNGAITGGPGRDAGWTFWLVRFDNAVTGWARQANLLLDALPAGPPPPPPTTTRTEVTYADLTLKNGRLFITRVDSGGTASVRVVVRSATQDSLGRYRGGGYAVRPFMAATVYPSHVRQTAADILDPTNHDTSDVTLQLAHVGSMRARCAPRTGCWVTVVNTGRTGSWTSSPKLNAVVLNGLAKALEAAGQRAPLLAADSLPYIRVVP